jgi:RHS repeat-associated protein
VDTRGPAGDDRGVLTIASWNMNQRDSAWSRLDALAEQHDVSVALLQEARRPVEARGGWQLHPPAVDARRWSQVVTATVSGQPAVTYSYDDTGALSGVVQVGVEVSLGRDDGGRLSRVDLPGGWSQEYGCDATGLVTSLTYAHDGTVEGEIAYSHTVDCMPATVTGSMASVTMPVSRTGLVNDEANRLTSAAGVAVTYDADGNMPTGNGRSYAWDERGRLASVTTPDGVMVPMGYGPDGGRTQRGEGAAATGFVDVGANTATELDADGEVTARLLSGGMDQWFARTTTGTDGGGGVTDAILTDVLGSPIALGQADGTLSASHAYDPHGAASVQGDVRGSDLGFTGRQDDGTGLSFHRARYYDPQLGRFMSEDPIGLAGGSNLYAYAANASTAYTDPTGHNPLLIGCVAGGLGEAGITYLGQRLSGRKVQWGQVGGAAVVGCVTGMLGSALLPHLSSLTNLGNAANSGSALVRAWDAAFRAADDPVSIFVKDKHLASAGGNGAKFASDDIWQVQDWISRGLKSDAALFLPNELDDTFRVIVPGGGVIGTKGQEFIRVIVTGDGRVINAFPVNAR